MWWLYILITRNNFRPFIKKGIDIYIYMFVHQHGTQTQKWTTFICVIFFFCLVFVLGDHTHLCSGGLLIPNFLLRDQYQQYLVEHMCMVLGTVAGLVPCKTSISILVLSCIKNGEYFFIRKWLVINYNYENIFSSFKDDWEWHT